MKRISMVLGAVIGILLYGAFFSAASDDSVQGDQTLTTHDESYELTLITGDKLTVHEVENGRLAVEMKPVRDDSDFEILEIDGEVYVIPDNIAEYIPEKIDRELFNITSLIEHGYDDASIDSIPLIIKFDDQESLNSSTASLNKSLSESNRFTSIDALAVKVDKHNVNNFTNVLFTMKGNSLQSTALLENNINQIRLDRKVEISLEDSVPQIGAPEAWESGYDGSNTMVAVLDSGIDKEHPDLKGKIEKEKNFSSDGTASDLHGHGTHVASIIAGTGAASDELRKGVAPGASLLNAKVMGEDGTGTESDIIAGMEWAAEEGADILNMSLGSSPTDGTDSLSEAVNNITEKFGVLFVIAAGNSGPGDKTVESPGTADSALTVGSVDKSDKLAVNSSRGPRVGDYVIKPDITAPGVDINAARADGTSMGTPIDDNYTTASGTSMATPHVAGAAALLIEKWKDTKQKVAPENLKSALISTAEPQEESMIPIEELTIYKQGGGRLNIQDALNQRVIASPGSLDMGYFEYPHKNSDLVTKTLTYQNMSDEEITMDLSLEIETEKGERIPDGMIELSKDNFTIKPEQTEEVEVTIHPELGELRLHGGHIIAESEDKETIIHSPVGFYKEAEMYTLTIKGTTEDGNPATSKSYVDVMNVEDKSIYAENLIKTWNDDGEIKLEVPSGIYNVMTKLEVNDSTKDRITIMGDPEIEIFEDTVLDFDARDAKEMTVDLEGDIRKEEIKGSYYRKAMNDTGSNTHHFSSNNQIFFGTMDTVKNSEFELKTQWLLRSNNKSSNNDYMPSVYNLVFAEQGVDYEDLNYEVKKEDLAQVENKYYSYSDTRTYKVNQYHFRPYDYISFATSEQVHSGKKRKEYFIPDDTRYKKTVQLSGGISLEEPETKYKKGKEEQTWFKQPLRPGVLIGNPPLVDHKPVFRKNNTLIVDLPEYVDARNNWSEESGESTFKIFENGVLLQKRTQPKGEIPLKSDKANYRLELITNNSEDMSPFSSTTHTNWIFHSEKPEDNKEEVIPMLTMDYDLDLDLTNTASLPKNPGGSLTLSFKIQQQPGADDIPIDGAKLWISYNDGEDWEEVDDISTDGDGQFNANLEDLKDNRDGTGYVSMKVEAEDEEGNRIEQKIIRTYKWNFEGDINGDDMIDIHDVIRAVAFYGTNNKKTDINGDGAVDEKDMRILEKNFLKVGPDANTSVKPQEKIGGKGLNDFLRSVGLEPEE